MKRFVMIATLLLGTIATAEEVNLENGKTIAETICASCHGDNGNSNISIYPRIAGQHTAYLEQHIKDIRDGKRTWGDMVVTMVPMVAELSDKDVKDVSAFYNKQLSSFGESENTNLKEGQAIYRAGIASQKVPACLACHGPAGAGIPAGSTAQDGIVSFPRITGQHKDYIVAQMQAFRNGSRSHAMMSTISTALTDQQIEDVANYIQGLH